MMDFNQAKKYHEILIRNDAVMVNIKNWFAHYLYGSNPEHVAKQSKQNVVYNPPGY